MIWVCLSVAVVAILAIIDWTARPRRNGNTPADADVIIPQPRSAEHDRSVRFTRPVDQD